MFKDIYFKTKYLTNKFMEHAREHPETIGWLALLTLASTMAWSGQPGKTDTKERVLTYDRN